MPTNYTGRVLLILGLLYLSVSALFPLAPVSLFRPFNLSAPTTWALNLRPGIDMVGGTSLLYEIQTGPDAEYNENLAEEVASALKRRVDPDGVKNLIWRPQGGSRLEIQLPMGRGATEAGPIRERFVEAQQTLEATNLAPGRARRAIERAAPEERERVAAEFAGGHVGRQQTLREMVRAVDRIESARQARDAAAEAEASLALDRLSTRLAETNVDVANLQRVLELSPAARQEQLAEVRQSVAGDPTQAAAVEAFTEAFSAYAEVRDTVDSAAQLKRDLRGSGVLQFHIVADDLWGTAEYQSMTERLREQGPRYRAGDTLRWFLVDRPGEIGVSTETYDGRPYVLVHTTPERSMAERAGQASWALERAYATTNELNERLVGFQFDPQGARYFGDLTSRHAPRADGFRYKLAVVLDERIVSAPNLNEPITQGVGTISGGRGGFTADEFRYLLNTLNAGALPARLTEEPIMERTVGPQLGADNLRRGLFACAAGVLITGVFLIGYYYLAGLVAFGAVLLNLVFILALMAAYNATFTLAGVAGVILTIGMAVDANVLIFERLREEQNRGLSLRLALRNAYDRAFGAILDSNITTGITAAILYYFGSEEVKGFGLTLMFGLFSSVFTALFVTKTVFGLLIDKFGLDNLSSVPLTFPKWDKLLNPGIDWLRLAKPINLVSGVIIVVGMTLFAVRTYGGYMLDTEFASGTAVQVELREPTRIEDVRRLIEAQADERAFPAPQVVSVGEDRRGYEIVTPSRDTAAVRSAVVEALGDRLDVAQPSLFTGVGTLYEQVTGRYVLPVTEDATSFGDFEADPSLVERHAGGVAIILNELTPPLSAGEIQRRIETRSLEGGGDFARSARSVSVQAFEQDAAAVVYLSDPRFPYVADDPIVQQQWADQLAAPAWTLVGEAVNAPAELRQVISFDPQVAGETARAATFALILSCVVIVAYIWLRFGDLRYGTATVVALIHDVLFTLACIGFAHYLAETFVGQALLLDPFRLNLTLVAAILTIMGFSMNDTVVVFDRIRENRTLVGHVDRKVINDSINQTLSRTLLTGTTTLVTLFVMYVFGGSGIHGFTFALVVGFIAGTFSSIAIASPLLLLGVRGGRLDEVARPSALRQPVNVPQLSRAGM